MDRKDFEKKEKKELEHLWQKLNRDCQVNKTDTRTERKDMINHQKYKHQLHRNVFACALIVFIPNAAMPKKKKALRNN